MQNNVMESFYFLKHALCILHKTLSIPRFVFSLLQLYQCIKHTSVKKNEKNIAIDAFFLIHIDYVTACKKKTHAHTHIAMHISKHMHS